MTLSCTRKKFFVATQSYYVQNLHNQEEKVLTKNNVSRVSEKLLKQDD